MRRPLFTLLLVLGTICLSRADVTVGVIVGATGPGASLGIPYKNTFSILPATIGNEKVRFIILDDATDPTQAVTNARRLITEDKVDIILGSTSTPTCAAVTHVAEELKTPQIALSPLPATNPWAFSVPQPARVFLAPVVEHMKAHGVHTVAYIGFSDAWGDVVYSGLVPAAERAGIRVVTNERYARVDTSVTGQVLKILAVHPDAVLVGGSGTPGALPQRTLIERGYKGQIYHTPGVVNPDFLRIGGKSLEGAIAPTSPVMVAEQLPNSNPIKNVAGEFLRAYEGIYGAGSRNAFAPYSYDAFLLLAHAVPVALKRAKPGTPEFREALRAALESASDVVGTSAVYNMTPADHVGVDSRSVVLVRVHNGQWELLK